MPALNPPMTFGAMENVWKFVQTFINYEEMKQFLLENKCTCTSRTSNTGKWWQIRFWCNHRMSHNCPFALLAIKTVNRGYHVYQDGEHNNHPAVNMPTSEYVRPVYTLSLPRLMSLKPTQDHVLFDGVNNPPKS
jgi:hypothetical protein